jgi:dihydroorotate dehydrogenase
LIKEKEIVEGTSESSSSKTPDEDIDTSEQESGEKLEQVTTQVQHMHDLPVKKLLKITHDLSVKNANEISLLLNRKKTTEM